MNMAHKCKKKACKTRLFWPATLHLLMTADGVPRPHVGKEGFLRAMNRNNLLTNYTTN